MDRTPVQPSFIPIYDAFIKCRGILAWNIQHGLIESLKTFDPKLANDSDFICRLITSSTAVIDYGYRAFQLLDALPHFSKRSQSFRSLTDRSQQLKLCRNYLQHSRGDLQGNAIIDFPVLGSISWIHDGNCHAMALSQITGRYSFGTVAYDTWNNTWAWNVMVSFKSHYVYPEEILSLLDDCLTEVHQLVTIENDPYTNGSVGSLQAFNCTVINQSNQGSQQGTQPDAFGTG
jgi:hypothetical protein